eukprot:1222030-Rhodomonas_salina.1
MLIRDDMIPIVITRSSSCSESKHKRNLPPRLQVIIIGPDSNHQADPRNGVWSVKGRKWRELLEGSDGHPCCDRQNNTFALPPREHLHPAVLAFVQVASTIRIPPRIPIPSKRFSTCSHCSHVNVYNARCLSVEASFVLVLFSQVVFMTIADVGAALATMPDTEEGGCECSEEDPPIMWIAY